MKNMNTSSAKTPPLTWFTGGEVDLPSGKVSSRVNERDDGQQKVDS
jgi:hypothetical protein